MTDFFGSIPQMNRGPETPGLRPLFHSVRDISLIIEKTIQGGYGVLRAGTVLAEGTATGLLVPYATDDITDDNVARAYSTNDLANEADAIYVVIEDAYKFAVGDSIVLAFVDGTNTYHDGGAIISIDVTTDRTRALITFTTAIADVATFVVSDSLCCYAKAGTSGKFSTAKYVLDQDVNTGTGEGSLGANTSVVISNAVLYSGALVNYDSSAATDLGSVSDGRFVILK